MSWRRGKAAALSLAAVALGAALYVGGALAPQRPAKAAVIQLNGAGATFPYPIYSLWFDEYRKIDPSVQINYQSIGSGGGIRQITARTVDFGASDGPMTDEELRQVKGEILHIPTVIGAVAVVYNLPGIGSGLKLAPDVLADIFLGKIRNWSDPRIQKLNPGIKLPNRAIAVVHRSDGSGTTYVFTDYLSNVSREWKEKVGTDKAVRWPVGLGGKGNEGVAGIVRQTPGAIGYVELAYAIQNKLTYAAIRNKAGRFVLPTLEATSKAAAGVKIPDDYRVSIVNADGPEAYPIASFTWLLVYKEQDDPERGKKLVDFLWWAIHDGQKLAPRLHYAPLPKEVVQKLEGTLRQITYQGRPLLSR